MSKFLTILKISCSESCVPYIDNHKETFTYSDHSPYEILAILSQKLRNQEICKTVAHISSGLTSVFTT